jgi:hypothetical protein
VRIQGGLALVLQSDRRLCNIEEEARLPPLFNAEMNSFRRKTSFYRRDIDD